MAVSAWGSPTEGGVADDSSGTTVQRECGCPLRAVFYAEFDNKAGGKIVHQFPEGVFTAEHSKIFMSHIIANPEYCGKVAVVDSMVFPWTLVTLPCMVTGDKYDRKLFRFNVSFVVAKGRFQTEPYELALKKFGRVLKNMELRSGYLYGPLRTAEAAAAAAEAEETRRMEGAGRGGRMSLGGGAVSSIPSPSPCAAPNEKPKPRRRKRLFGSRLVRRKMGPPSIEESLDAGVRGRQGSSEVFSATCEHWNGDGSATHDDTSQAAPRLAEMLETVYKGLKMKGEVVMYLPGAAATCLSLRPFTPRTPLEKWLKVHSHDVPVRRCPGLAEGVDELSTLAPGMAQVETSFDMALMQVMPHMNGVKHIKKISVDTEVDIDLVKDVTLWSLYTKQISLTDVFRYSNVYVGTSRTAEYISRPDFATSCWERIAKPCLSPGSGGSAATAAATATDAVAVADPVPVPAPAPEGVDDSGGALEWGGRRFSVDGVLDGVKGREQALAKIPPVPHPMCLSRLYLLFDGERTVQEVLKDVQGVGLEEVDHRSMCAFGVEVGILRRLHCYPLCVTKSEDQTYGRADPQQRARESSSSAAHDDRNSSPAGAPERRLDHPTELEEKFELEAVQKLCDGTRTEDALCCYLGCSLEELANFVTSDGTMLYRTLMI